MFRGSYVALVTPMTQDEEIDWPAFEALIHWHIEEGTEGLVIAGSTGEESTLTKDEKIALFKKSVEIARGKVVLIATTGSNCTREAVELTRLAKATGVDGAIAILPYCNRPVEEGIHAHYLAIAGVGLPFIVYHHPGRAGVRLSAEALARLCEIPEVAAVKETSGDLGLATDLVSMVDKPILSGDDCLALAHLGVGFAGVISVVGNLIPRQWGDFVRAPTREAFYEMYDLCKATILESNPQCVKYAVSLMGKCEPVLRLPMILPKEVNRKKIEEALRVCLEMCCSDC